MSMGKDRQWLRGKDLTALIEGKVVWENRILGLIT